MSWLLDTCVISEFTKKSPFLKVVQWVVDHEAELFLSVLTIGEVHKGILLLPDNAQRKRLERWLQHDLRERFAGRILAIDENVCLTWGQILASAGQPLPAIDSLIAATAVTHQLTVVTRNIADMNRTGAKWFNPWEDRTG